MTDLLAGKKEIMDYLRCSDWSRVEKLIKEGLPVMKIAGRWEALKSGIDTWYKRQTEGAVNIS